MNRNFKKVWRRILRIQILFIFLLTTPSSFADQLVTKNGQKFEGDLIGMEGGYLSLQETKSGSTSLAIRRFTLEETDRIEFSDSPKRLEAFEIYSNDHFAEVIPLLETLAFRRLPFIGKLQLDDERVFSALLLSYSSTGLFDKCLERHKLWHRKLTHREAIEDSSIAAMKSARQAKRLDEAALFAQRWIDEERSSEKSAIAWLILSELAAKTEDHENALWISLQPIAFADRQAPEELEACYEIAIVSASLLREPSLPLQLTQEMIDRGYSPKHAITSSNTRPFSPPSDRDINPSKIIGTP